MSVVEDQVRRLDAQLDRILISDEYSIEENDVSTVSSPRLDELLHIVKALSTTSSSHALLPSWRLQSLLLRSGLVERDLQETSEERDPRETEIEWLLVSKAAVQTYGLLISTLLDQIIPLSNDIWYWDEVLSSYSYSSLYTIQTSPLRLWAMTKDIYRETRSRLQSQDDAAEEATNATRTGLFSRWHRFYDIVHESIQERSLVNIQRKMLSPIALSRGEGRRKRATLKKLRSLTASGLGVLVEEGLTFVIGEDHKADPHDDWKGVVERSVALMDMVVKEVLDLHTGVSEFEERVFAGVEQDPELSIHVEDHESLDKPAILATRLVNLLELSIPDHMQATDELVAENGRPPFLVRYWLPLGAALLSSSTLLRILVNRKADIAQWATDFGVTIRDFWMNWCVEPVRKVIGTIRHDANSEIAIMSRDSLRADRESLERMVVDFAVDKPHFVVSDSPLSQTQIAEIRNKVAEGDVTPVLRAFEKELKSPLFGAVRGDLVRSLLIQVQKTKVDLEVALSGIDSLLKSQELVFGFVGLTPGILVSIGIFQYFRNVLGSRRGVQSKQRAGKSVRVLRNIDRILTEATPVENGLLSYKDRGLLLCEVHVLRNLVHRLMPRGVEKELLEDIDDLVNARGIQMQTKVLERIRWSYQKWLR